MKIFIITGLLFLSGFAQAEKFTKCKSFDGKWSRATLTRMDSKDYRLQLDLKFYGKKSVSFITDAELLGYRDRDYDDFSPYEEVSYELTSNDFPKGLKVKYMVTSDGDDYLYLKTSDFTSALVCK